MSNLLYFRERPELSSCRKPIRVSVISRIGQYGNTALLYPGGRPGASSVLLTSSIGPCVPPTRRHRAGPNAASGDPSFRRSVRWGRRQGLPAAIRYNRSISRRRGPHDQAGPGTEAFLADRSPGGRRRLARPRAAAGCHSPRSPARGDRLLPRAAQHRMMPLEGKRREQQAEATGCIGDAGHQAIPRHGDIIADATTRLGFSVKNLTEAVQAVRMVDFLMRTHLDRRKAPHPLPPSLPEDKKTIASSSWQCLAGSPLPGANPAAAEHLGRRGGHRASPSSAST